jgi:hypothetical protein
MRTILVILVIPASLLVTAPPVHAAAVYCGGEIATIVGTDASETIYGTSERDVIYAAGGADRIFGGPLPDPCYDDLNTNTLGSCSEPTGVRYRDRVGGGDGTDSIVHDGDSWSSFETSTSCDWDPDNNWDEPCGSIAV